MPNASPDVKRILEKALSITADGRYATALAFRDDIDEFVAKAGEEVTADDVGKAVGALSTDRRRALEHVLDRELGDHWRSGHVPERRLPPSLRGTKERPAPAPSEAAPSQSRSARSGETATSEKRAAPVLSDSGAHPRVTESPLPSPLTETSDGQTLPLSSTWDARKKPRRVWPMALVGAVGIVALGAVFVRGFATRAHAEVPSPDDPRAARTTPSGESAPSPPTSPQPFDSAKATDLVTLTVKTTPPEAMVSLDGVRLTENPFVARFPKDGTAHQLTFDAPGYTHRAQLVSFDHDIDLTVKMDRAQRLAPFLPNHPQAAHSAGGIDERDPWTLKPKH